MKLRQTIALVLCAQPFEAFHLPVEQAIYSGMSRINCLLRCTLAASPHGDAAGNDLVSIEDLPRPDMVLGGSNLDDEPPMIYA